MVAGMLSLPVSGQAKALDYLRYGYIPVSPPFIVATRLNQTSRLYRDLLS